MSSSPSAPPASAIRTYVALVHAFWASEQTADQGSHGANLAARVCLGTDSPGAPANLDLVDPKQCGARATALLTIHETFLSSVDRITTPAAFVEADQVLRVQLPKSIADLKALMAAAATGSREAVLQAATVYNNDMYPAVTDALNEIDPAVAHP